MSDDFDDQWGDDDDGLDWADWLARNVLLKTGQMTFQQWVMVAGPYTSFCDDYLDHLQEKAPNVARLNKKDMAYVMNLYVRHQHTLTDADNKRPISERQLRQMRRTGASLK